MQAVSLKQTRSRARHWEAWLGGAGLLAGTAAATLGYALWVEPMQIELEQLTIRLPNAAGRLPAGGLRILHLSDSHFRGHTWRERWKIERIRRLVAGLEYDLLIHTGDFVHYDSGLENVRTLLNKLPRARLGSFGVLGNHDYRQYAMAEALPRMWRTFCALDDERTCRAPLPQRAYYRSTRWPRYIWYVRNTPLDGRRTGFNDAAQLAQVLGSQGMRLLHNQALHLHCPKEGLDLYLAGVDDVLEGRPHLEQTLASVPKGASVILLSHNPDIVASPRIHNVDVILAGHTHGGQIKLPLWGPAHTQVEYVARKDASGYFRVGRTHVYITRGIGEGFPLRFCAGPQLALITIR